MAVTGITKIADVIEPVTFAKYVMDKTTEKSEIMNAGVVENNATLDAYVRGGGTTFTMPKWNDLTGESQTFSEKRDITVSKITSHKEIGTKIMRANAWGAHDLAGAMAGDDPMKAIADRVSDWWVRDEKRIIMNILKGIFAAESMAPLKFDGAKHQITGNMVIDAKTLMGDAADDLTMIYMHSHTFAELQKQNMIQFIPMAESKIQIPTYLGYRVICDDSAPVAEGSGDGKIYTTYLLSRGCIQRGSGQPVDFVGAETDRDSLGSTDILINRQAKILHPKGISWIGDSHITDETPNNAELGTGTNWELVTDIKKIGIVQLTHLLKEPVPGA